MPRRSTALPPRHFSLSASASLFDSIQVHVLPRIPSVPSTLRFAHQLTPATGPLRFSRPVPKEYDGSVLAHAPGPACLQPPGPAAGEYGMSEDCLSLNIMVPSGHGKGLPVMVFL